MPWVTITWVAGAAYAVLAPFVWTVERNFLGGRKWTRVRWLYHVVGWTSLIASVPAFAWWAPLPTWLASQVGCFVMVLVLGPIPSWLWRHRLVRLAIVTQEGLVEHVAYEPSMMADNPTQVMGYRYDALVLGMTTSLSEIQIAQVIRSGSYKQVVARFQVAAWGLKPETSREAWRAIYALDTTHELLQGYNELITRTANELAHLTGPATPYRARPKT